MKFQIKNIFAVLLLATTLFSCTDDKSPEEEISGMGTLKLKFDNTYGGANLAMNTAYNNPNGEVITVTRAKYIVSNIVLTKEDGTLFTVPKSQSYFIVDELEVESLNVNIPNVPAGNYTKVQYGIGVDEAQWALGAAGQGDFLAKAQAANMMWSWTAGYKFVNFEGTFTTATNATPTVFKLHTGKTGTDYNYKEVSLSFPDKAMVRTTISPAVHVFADLSKLIDGTNRINFSEGASIMGGAKLGLVTSNLTQVFKVDHVHNDK